MFKDEMEKAADACGISLTQEKLAMFCRYYDMLADWNEKMNLTAIIEPKEAALKHFMDSLLAYDDNLFFDGTKVIDIGSGAGFPGLPLKIYNDKLNFVLLDSSLKRIGFLQAVIDELGLRNVVCLHARAEDAARDTRFRETFDVAVARAVAPLNVLVEYALPFVKLGGTFLALKGMRFEEEIDLAAAAVKELGGGSVTFRRIKLPYIDDVRAAVLVKKLAATKKKYPRKAGTPTKKPIIN